VSPNGKSKPTSGLGMFHFVVKNEGAEDEYVHLTVSDENGYTKKNSASQ
jgi:hypothetical protein